MNVCQNRKATRTARHYQWYRCEQCGNSFLSNAVNPKFCSPECFRIATNERSPKKDILDQIYDSADWLIIRDATPEDEGGFFNKRSKISTTHLEAMAYERSLAEGSKVMNVKTGEEKIVDYRKMRGVRSRQRVTVGMFLRNIRQGE